MGRSVIESYIMESDKGTFGILLAESGMRKSQLASALGLHKGTVVAWKDNPPGYALAYLRLYIKHTKYRALESAIKAIV